MPVKALVRSAEIAYLLSRAADFGLQPAEILPDFSAIFSRTRRIVDSMSGGRRKMDSRGIDVIYGGASFISPHVLLVADEQHDERFEADRFIIATGARPVIPQVAGLQQTGYWSSFDAVYPDRQPESLVIIGGSAIGCEFAQIYSRLGTRVVIIEMREQILGGEDSENAALLASILKSEGIQVMLETTVAGAGSVADGKKVICQDRVHGETELYSDEVLVAAGRVPALEGLGLDAAGVEVRAGSIKVDASLQTSQPHMWACGDAIGKPMLSHMATYEGNVAGANAAASDVDGKTKVDYRVSPTAIFTDPPLASVGISEAAANDGGLEVLVGRARYAESERAAALGEREGLVKLVADRSTRKILGAHIVGAGADMLIHELVTALGSGLTLDALLRPRCIHIHPTLSELIGMAAASAR